MQVQNATPSSLLTRAKQGDPKALTQLMGDPLKRKGIRVNVDRKGALLYVSLTGQSCPPKAASLRFLEQGLTKLEMTGIDAVRVSGYQDDNYHPLWVERIALNQGQPRRSNARYRPEDSASHHSPHANAHHAQGGAMVAAPSSNGTKHLHLMRSLLILGAVLFSLLFAGLVANMVNAPSPNELPGREIPKDGGEQPVEPLASPEA